MDEKEDDEDVSSTCPIKRSLSNSLILETILSQKGFTPEEYRSLRLVSSHFNHAIVSNLPFPPPLTLNLGTLFHDLAVHNACCEIRQGGLDLPPLTKDLCRRSRLDYECQCQRGSGDNDTPDEDHRSKSIAALNATEFFRLYGSQVQDLTLHDANEGTLESIGQLLSSGNCSHLKKLHISYMCNCGAQTKETEAAQSQGEDDGDKGTFLQLSNLRAIYLEGSRTKTLLGNCPPWKNFVERLVQSSPNLEDLTISHNIYFSLERNRKLKSLTFHGDCEREDYSLEGMTDMSSQVYESLEELTIHPYPKGTTDGKTGKTDFCSLSLPSFPKLRTFQIRFPQGNPFGSRLATIRPRNMPRLRSLILSTNHVDSLSTFMGDLPNGEEWKSVKTLKLEGPVKPKHLVFLKLAFPNLQKLSVRLGTEGQVCEDEPRSPNLNDIFVHLSSLFLIDIEAKLNFPFRWYQFHRALTAHGSTLFQKGRLKRFKLIAKDETYLGSVGYVPSIHNLLLMTKGMESVTFVSFTLRCGTTAELVKFCQKNRLPITFLDFDQLNVHQ